MAVINPDQDLFPEKMVSLNGDEGLYIVGSDGLLNMRERVTTLSVSESAAAESLNLRKFFKANLGRWTEFYKRTNVKARIYQDRQATAVSHAESLRLPSGSRVLDVGCGPGFTSVALAHKDYIVHAVDFVEEMTAVANKLGRAEQVGDRLRATVGDATCLPFPSGVFDLVIMLGVTEWVRPLDSLVREAARVIKPGGYLIIAWNNRWALHLILDPASNPLLRSLRRALRRRLEERGWIAPPPPEYVYALKDLKNALRTHSMVTVKTRGIGFGPFSLLWLPLLPEGLGGRLNCGLQTLADTRLPLLKSVARNHVAVAYKAA